MMRSEDPKAIFFERLPRIKLENFRLDERRVDETIAEFVERNRITDAELSWLEGQPLCGEPSLKRLRAAFAGAGFQDISLHLHEHRDTLEFRVRLTAQVGVADSEQLLRLLIRLARSAGFRVGFCELGIRELDGTFIHGSTLTDDMDLLFERGAPMIEQDGHG
jgi:hypothetical protein